MIILESSNFLSYIKDHLPSKLKHNNDFKEWLNENPSVIYDFTDELMMTVPSPRYKYYQDNDFNKIKNNVLSYTNDVIDGIGGFFMVNSALPLLNQLEIYSMLILYIGLVADILILLFAIIAILLIYSLLMISIETKTF